MEADQVTPRLRLRRSTSRSRARNRRLALVAVVGLVLQIVCTAHLVESLTLASERAGFAPEGEMVRLGDSTWHLHCSGFDTALTPIVFEAGLGDSSATWADLQGELSEQRRVCSYDRLGYGWSSAARGERSPAVAAAELAGVLRRAGEEERFIVVAHSLGGLIAREFAAEEPELVAGLVLIDPTNEDALSESAGIALAVTTAEALAASLGATRPFLVEQLSGEAGGGALPDGLGERAGFLYREEALWTAAAELSATDAQIADITVPTLVVLPSTASPRDREHYAGVGPHVAFEDAATAAHYVHYAEPSAVLSAIATLDDQLSQTR